MREWTRDEVLTMHTQYMDDGKTLRELGAEHGVTYERVRQLFKQYELPTKKFKRQTLRRYEQEFEAWQRRDEIIEAYKKVGTVDDTARTVGIPRQYVGPVISTYELRHLYRKKGEAASYDEDYILTSLQRAAQLCGEPLTIPAYRKVAPANDFPADLTVIRAFGTWRDACERAGVRANPSEGPRAGAITVDQCLAALRECATDIKHVPSYSEYNKWAKDNKRPSGPTVRVKIGPWRFALTLAFDEADEE